jgi:hypothetical protein
MKKNLPNASIVFILGLISLLGSCLSVGTAGVVFGIIGIIKSKNDLLLYQQNPSQYDESSYKNLKIGRTMSIIGLVISLLFVIIFFLFTLSIGFASIMAMFNGKDF